MPTRRPGCAPHPLRESAGRRLRSAELPGRPFRGTVLPSWFRLPGRCASDSKQLEVTIALLRIRSKCIDLEAVLVSDQAPWGATDASPGARSGREDTTQRAGFLARAIALSVAQSCAAGL